MSQDASVLTIQTWSTASACALIMEGNYFLVKSRHCAISINYLYTNKGGLALPEKKHTVSFSNMPVERQI